jgi:hypothetical protein
MQTQGAPRLGACTLSCMCLGTSIASDDAQGTLAHLQALRMHGAPLCSHALLLLSLTVCLTHLCMPAHALLVACCSCVHVQASRTACEASHQACLQWFESIERSHVKTASKRLAQHKVGVWLSSLAFLFGHWAPPGIGVLGICRW